jgi:hypothetical protein
VSALPYIDVKAGDTLTIDGTVYTVREPWSSFGRPWMCACALVGKGDPALFYSDVASAPLVKGYTLRVPNPHGPDSWRPVKVRK